VTGDTNHRRDIFVRDVRAGTTTRVSVSGRGKQANLDSYNPSISDDGRYVVFDSFATNLVPDDLNREGDVFLRDLSAGTTTRVSHGPDGKETDAGSGFAVISGDGSVIAFESSATNLRAGSPGRVTDIYVVDRTGKVLDWVDRSPAGGEPNGGSGDIALSRDGRMVAFASAASNLVPGDTNLSDDVFVRDRAERVTQRVSVNSIGGEGNDDSGAPSISDDGRYVAFTSNASTLVSLTPGTQSLPQFIFNRFNVGDENFVSDVFVHDLFTGHTEMVSVDSNGAQGAAESYEASISGDGTKVAFASFASELVPGPLHPGSEIFLRDLRTHQTTRVSVATGNQQGNGMSVQPAISTDGTRIAFTSEASNLVPGDRNHSGDVFVRD
jgi:Tol biopolymer transport system component